MRSVHAALLSSLFLLPLSRAGAQPFDAREVPADAKWVLHLDMDAVQASKVGAMLTAKLDKDPRAQAGLNEVQILSGMKIPQDLHDVTIYGKDFTPEGGVVLIHAVTDQAKVVNALKLNPTYASATYGAYEVHTWTDKGKTMHGSYHGAGLILISQSESNLQTALDVLDHKGDAVAPNSPLVAGANKGDLLYLAGTGLTELKPAKEPKSPVLAQVEGAVIAVREQGPNLLAHGTITASALEAAEQIRASLEGIKAIVTLSASGENADAKAKSTAEALQNFTIKAQDKVLTLDWPLSLEMVRTWVDNMGARPATAPAVKVAPVSGTP